MSNFGNLPFTMRIFNEFDRSWLSVDVIPIPTAIPNDIEMAKQILYIYFVNFEDLPSDNSTPSKKATNAWWNRRTEKNKVSLERTN